MVGTLFSALVALYLFFNPLPEDTVAHSTIFAAVLFLIGTLTLLVALSVTLFSWTPLQMAEQHATPGILRAFTKDRHLRWTSILIIIFFILTYVFSIDLLFIHEFNPTYLLIGWSILLGAAIDFVRHLLHRVMNYLDPLHVIEFFGQRAQASVRKSDFKEVCDWIENFAETSIKALTKYNLSLSLSSIDKMRALTKGYLAQAKNIHYNDESEEKIEDHINYTLFYLFQRIEMIYTAALKQRLEPVCSNIITMLGKVAIYCAKFDISIAHYPLFYVGKLTSAAQQKGLDEVGNRATLTMLEVGKVIIEEVDIQYVDIKETFLTIVNNMQKIAQETFQNDKAMNISLLTQPFYQLKELFLKGKASSHQDAPVILSHIDQVLNEFTTLETVLNTMPPIPELEKEREKMEKEEEPPTPATEEDNG